MTDSELIALFNNRDEAALRAAEQRFGGLCRSVAANILADRRDVEECVSTVFFKLWSAIPPAEPRDLTAYVAKAARNEALSVYRACSAKRRFAVSVPLEELDACLAGALSADEEPTAKELARAIEAFLSRLPERQRGVFMRRYWFFDDAKTIAGLYGVTERRVNSLLARTRRELRAYLIKEEFINE